MICFAVAAHALATTWYGDAGTASLSFEAGGLQWRVIKLTGIDFSHCRYDNVNQTYYVNS
jgi:hypothetical protein